MDLRDLFDGFIEDAVTHGYTSEQAMILLLDEDFHFFHEGVGRAELLETVRRVRRKVGGINVTMRKTGRPNPIKSQRAKRAARAHKARRMAAMRRFQRSPKARQMRRVMARVRKTKRHAGPRKSSHPKVARPRKRPTYRRRR
jgi:hypothetical protein